MRRMFFSLLAVGCLSTLLAGCKHHTGCCDCEDTCSNCTHSAPWAHNVEPGPVHAVPISEHVPLKTNGPKTN